MSSSDIKEQLDEWITELYEDNDEEELLVDILGKWKRLSKTKNSEGKDVRIFENTFLNKKIMTIDEKIKGFLAEGNYVFHLYQDTDEDGKDMVCIMISDYDYYKKDQCCSDWHLTHLVALPEFLDEIMEASFISYRGEEITRDALIQMGFIEDPTFSTFIQKYK